LSPIVAGASTLYVKSQDGDVDLEEANEIISDFVKCAKKQRTSLKTRRGEEDCKLLVGEIRYSLIIEALDDLIDEAQALEGIGLSVESNEVKLMKSYIEGTDRSRRSLEYIYNPNCSDEEEFFTDAMDRSVGAYHSMQKIVGIINIPKPAFLVDWFCHYAWTMIVNRQLEIVGVMMALARSDDLAFRLEYSLPSNSFKHKFNNIEPSYIQSVLVDGGRVLTRLNNVSEEVNKSIAMCSFSLNDLLEREDQQLGFRWELFRAKSNAAYGWQSCKEWCEVSVPGCTTCRSGESFYYPALESELLTVSSKGEGVYAFVYYFEGYCEAYEKVGVSLNIDGKMIAGQRFRNPFSVIELLDTDEKYIGNWGILIVPRSAFVGVGSNRIRIDLRFQGSTFGQQLISIGPDEFSELKEGEYVLAEDISAFNEAVNNCSGEWIDSDDDGNGDVCKQSVLVTERTLLQGGQPTVSVREASLSFITNEVPDDYQAVESVEVPDLTESGWVPYQEMDDQVVVLSSDLGEKKVWVKVRKGDVVSQWSVDSINYVSLMGGEVGSLLINGSDDPELMHVNLMPGGEGKQFVLLGNDSSVPADVVATLHAPGSFSLSAVSYTTFTIQPGQTHAFNFDVIAGITSQGESSFGSIDFESNVGSVSQQINLHLLSLAEGDPDRFELSAGLVNSSNPMLSIINLSSLLQEEMRCGLDRVVVELTIDGISSTGGDGGVRIRVVDPNGHDVSVVRRYVSANSNLPVRRTLRLHPHMVIDRDTLILHVLGDPGDAFSVSDAKLRIETYSGEPDVHVIKTVSDENPIVGDLVQVSVRLVNVGENIADSGFFDDSILPAGFTFVGGEIAESNMHRLEPDESTTYTYNVRVDDPGGLVMPPTQFVYEDQCGENVYTCSSSPVLINVTQTSCELTTDVFPEGCGYINIVPMMETYPVHTEVLLQAVPVSGYTFAGWTGDALNCFGGAQCSFVIDKDVSPVANFVPITYYFVVPGVDVDGEYVVSWSPIPEAISYQLEESLNSEFDQDIDLAYEGAELYAVIHNVEHASYYYRFRAVFEDVVGDWHYSTGPCIVGDYYFLDVEPMGSGHGQVNWEGESLRLPCTIAMPESSEVTLVATANPGSVFDVWEEVAPLSPTIPYNSVNVEMDSDKQYRVYFREIDIVCFEVDQESLFIPEGDSGLIHVWLSHDPGGPVEVSLTVVGEGAALNVEGSGVLHFDETNWHESQSLSIHAIEDADNDDGLGTLWITADGLESSAIGIASPDMVPFTGETDVDGDGVIDSDDNCPFAANPDQADVDGDGVGDVCEVIGLGELIFGYEAFDFPQSPPWDLVVEEEYLSIGNGLLEIEKTWSGAPHQMMRMLDGFTVSQEGGVTLSTRYRFTQFSQAQNSTPLAILLTDDQAYFVYLLIYPDRISQHYQNNYTPEEVVYLPDGSDGVSQWHELVIVLEERFLKVYIDGSSLPILDTFVTGRYLGPHPNQFHFGVSGSASALGNGFGGYET